MSGPVYEMTLRFQAEDDKAAMVRALKLERLAGEHAVAERVTRVLVTHMTGTERPLPKAPPVHEDEYCPSCHSHDRQIRLHPRGPSRSNQCAHPWHRGY